MLWIGAILCFIAYSIQVKAQEHPPGDNVRIDIIASHMTIHVHGILIIVTCYMYMYA